MPPSFTRRALLAATASLSAPPAWAQARPRPPAPAPKAEPRPDDNVAPGWRRQVLIRWGDRVAFDAPAWNPRNIALDDATTQFGWDARVLGVVPQPPGEDGIARLVLAVSHPSAEARMMFPGGSDRPMVAAAAQGASILNLEFRRDTWTVVDGGFQARRLTAHSLCRIAGPAADLVGTTVQGVLAVRGGCATPWGTVLLAEGDPLPWFDRLRDEDTLFADDAHAAGFAWIVELDPLDPLSIPIKRTALGRFPREDAAATLAKDGRAVVFMTDARTSGLLFRFVSAAPADMQDASANARLLDDGTLAVAQVDGPTLRWTDLPDTPVSRVAALDTGAAGARFDTPSGLAIGRDGALFLACRGNPQKRGGAGQVLTFRPQDGDPAAATWHGDDPPITGPAIRAPRTLGCDATGRLWIGTDQADATAINGLFVRDAAIYSAPRGAAIAGIAFAPDATVFTAVSHPGAEPGATYDKPATRWPTLRPDTPPQSTVISLGMLIGR